MIPSVSLGLSITPRRYSQIPILYLNACEESGFWCKKYRPRHMAYLTISQCNMIELHGLSEVHNPLQ